MEQEKISSQRMNFLIVVKREKAHRFEYTHKVCTVASKPWKDIIKFSDPNAVKEPMDGTSSEDSLPSIPENLEIDDDTATITISSDEGLEQSRAELDAEHLVSLEMSN